MAMWTLAVAAATQAAVAVAFFFVGYRLSRRPVDAASRAPARAFVLWWWALSAYLAMQALLLSLAIENVTPLGLHLIARLIAGPLLCAGVAGLGFHILFILTGRRGSLLPLAAYYALAALAYDGLTIAGHPSSVVVGAWQVDLGPTPPSSLPWSIVLASIGLPVILCSLAFILIARRLLHREQRYRAALVGSSLLAWIGSGLAAQLGGSDVQKFVTLVLFGLGAAVLCLIAYYPPRPIRAWLERGAEASVDEPAIAPPQTAPA